jgi:hypothetical protein
MEFYPMKFLDDLPFYLVVFSVLINILLGIMLDTEIVTLMIRSIIVTIIFTILGLLLSSTLREAAKTIKKNNKGYTKENIMGSTIDIKIPPADDEDMINYDSDVDEFQEINPAYLHKRSEQE